MRIIDKNTDYYDFYQNVYKDNTFTFDRRNSFLLTKQMVCYNLDKDGHWNYKTKKREPKKFNYALLQICNNFWLFLIEVIKVEKDNGWLKPLDCNIELLVSWRNFDKPRKLCSFETIRFDDYHYNIDNHEFIYNKVDDLATEIDRNNYKVKKQLGTYKYRKGEEWVERNIPILKACGISECIDAHEIYLAFEEYFSLEKSDSERREPIGTTDVDKVESHGFDKKTSFRGK